MILFDGFILIFLLVWACAVPLAYLYLKHLITKYDELVNKSGSVVTHKYQWESKELWEASLTRLSKLFLKFSSIFSPISIILSIAWYFAERFRLYISVLGVIFFFVSLIVLMVSTTKIHKSFCPKGWFWKSYSNGKTVGFGIL